MDNLQREIEENFRRLAENPYPGRGIVLGRSREGRLLQFYWIMGRSEHSRNRYFSKEFGDVHTQPLNRDLLEDPSLVIYRAMGEVAGHYLVSNGDHTESLLEDIQAGGTFHEALERHHHEPDAPHLTPRIAGGIRIREGRATAWLGIIKADPFDVERSTRYYYEYGNIPAGFGRCITTYRGNGTPLPPFMGDPFILPLQGEGAELVPWIWFRLNERNRISLALKIIDPDTGKSEILLENKYAT